MEDIDAPPFWAAQLKHATGYEGKVDRWQIIRFEAPCTIAIDVGVRARPAPAAQRTGDRSKGVNGYVLNTITPETDKTCHYFWAFARNYSLGEQRLTHELREGVAGIFREDELILEAQQQAIDEHPGYTLLQPQHRRRLDVGAQADRQDGQRAKRKPRRSSRRVIPAAPAAAWTRAVETSVGSGVIADRAHAAAAARADRRRRAEARQPHRRARARRTPRRLAHADPAWRSCGCRKKACSKRCRTAASSVKDFSEADIHDAIEVRGTLEGLAARLAAERGVTSVLMAEARELPRPHRRRARAAASSAMTSFDGYVEQNGAFHTLLAEMSGSDAGGAPDRTRR